MTSMTGEQPYYMVMWLGFTAVVIIIMQLTRRGGLGWITIRKLPALEAMEEAVGRATEMGKPVIICPGQAPGYSMAFSRGETASTVTAATEIVGYMSGICARLGARIMVPIMFPSTIPMVTDAVRSGYIKEGKLDQFNPDSVYFVSAEGNAYNAYMFGLFQAENPAVFVNFSTAGIGTSLDEAARNQGAIVIGGVARTSQVSTRVATTDYFLMGAELYAAGAFISEDRMKMSTIFTEDLFKVVTVALLFLGTIAATLGSDIIITLMAG